MSSDKSARLVLHIGMHKTGSTSIQRFFSRNRRILRWFGIVYPEALGTDGRRLSKHNDYFHAISHEKDFGEPHPVYGPSLLMVQALALEVLGRRATLLSSEGLSGESPAFAQAFAPLAGWFPVRVVCFLRRQDIWAESFYRQMVMSDEVREARGFEDWLADPATRAHLNYEHILGWWAEVFGVGSVRAEPYPPEGPLLPAFLTAAGLPSWLTWLPSAHAWLNRSPTDAEVIAKRVQNGGAPRGSLRFEGAARTEFLALYAASTQRIMELYRPDLDQFFEFPVDI